MGTNVSQYIAIESDIGGGGLFSWDTEDTTQHEQLAPAWVAAGLDPALLPPTPSVMVALKRALDEVWGDRFRIRPLKKGHSWTVVREDVTGDVLNTIQLVTVRLDMESNPKVTLLIDDSRMRADAERVSPLYEQHRRELATVDVGKWLRGLIARLDGIPWRRQGGSYFILPEHVPFMRTVASVLKQVSSHVINELPVLECSKAIDTVLAKLEKQTLDEIAEIHAYFDERARQDRAYESRRELVLDIRRKVAKYESAFQRPLVNVDNAIKSLSRRLSDAAKIDEALTEGRGMPITSQRALLDLSDIRPIRNESYIPNPCPGDRILDLD